MANIKPTRCIRTHVNDDTISRREINAKHGNLKGEPAGDISVARIVETPNIGRLDFQLNTLR